MIKVAILLLIIIAGTALPAVLSAAGKRPAADWNYYHFDGNAFKPGPAVDGSAFVAVREKVHPVIVTTHSSNVEQTALPDGAGVIAGICYIQSSGGKLVGGGGFKPVPRVPLLISTAGNEFVSVQTDDNGYFVVVLPAGTYSVGSGQFTAEITVGSGITTLAPLRVGKRMVD
jgi:hypothetical protein